MGLGVCGSRSANCILRTNENGLDVILTDREIRNSIEAGQFDIIPRPPIDHYSSTTVDLTLSPVLRIYKAPEAGMKQAVDPGRPGFNATKLINSLTDRQDIDQKDGFDLERGFLILGWTNETVDLKDNCRVAARVEGKALSRAWGSAFM